MTRESRSIKLLLSNSVSERNRVLILEFAEIGVLLIAVGSDSFPLQYLQCLELLFMLFVKDLLKSFYQDMMLMQTYVVFPIQVEQI